MGMYIEIEKGKAESLSENLEKGLRYMGKAMSIAEEMCEGGEMGYRNNMGHRGSGGGMGMRSGYRGGMGYRDEDEEYDDYGEPKMGMRRGGRHY